MENVILVDKNDISVGTMEKMEAHQKGLLHRAFSIFIVNSKGEILLQQRAESKYHSPNLWTNTCCSHPRPNEAILNAANRRLQEEMGMKCDLTFLFSFIYNEKLDNELTEHELDHVFIGNSDSMPCINPDEVSNYRYVSINDIKNELKTNPETFTIWFKICFKKVIEYIR